MHLRISAMVIVLRPDGRRCRSWPIRGEPYCLWHSPEREEEAADARRLGGQRRRREKTVSGAFDLSGLDSAPSIRRIVEIALLDVLGLENSIGPRSGAHLRRPGRSEAPRGR